MGGFVYPLHAQAGTSSNHARISLKAAALLPHADRAGCRLYQACVLLHLPDASSYFYPDVLLACGEGGPPDPYFETEPCFVAEVLSPSTADIDRRHKYAAYTAIPSLQTYLLAAQHERHVVVYQRTADGWSMQELRGSGEVAVPCLGTALRLEDIYGGVVDG